VARDPGTRRPMPTARSSGWRRPGGPEARSHPPGTSTPPRRGRHDHSGTPDRQFRDTVKTFPATAGLVRAVDSVTLDIDAGEIFGIIDYSGAGKSTLVQLINDSSL